MLNNFQCVCHGVQGKPRPSRAVQVLIHLHRADHKQLIGVDYG